MSSSFLSLSPQKHEFCSWNLRSCCSSPRNFDLSLQPIVCAEILSKYSLVCDSSTPPIRFLIGGFISDYLVVLGVVLMSLDAPVEIYFPSFVASLCLGEVSRVICLNSFLLNPCFCNFSKISQNE